jgi:hypothetical protein
LFFFHFGDALEFVSLYNQNENFAELIQIITVTALVPFDEIENYWPYYIKSIYNFDDENVKELLNYVKRNWMCNTRPMFGEEVCYSLE